MPTLLTQSLLVLKGALERRGGGWYAARAVIVRSYKILRTIGWKGFVQRIRGANRRITDSYVPVDSLIFPSPARLDAISLRVGVMAHIFYADLIDEFVEQLSQIPVPFLLMVSVTEEANRQVAIAKFSTIDNLSALHVRVVPNRGRDIAPMLVAYREEILGLDVVCHIHTKKSLYTGSEQGGWREYLVGSLLGSDSRIAWILGMFQAAPDLGMIYPESFQSVPLTAHTWLSNKEHARDLGARLGIPIVGDAYLDFPAGSMFWARVDALRPLYELQLGFEDFPEENGQTDGTLQHAVERMLAQVVRQQKMIIGILPTDHALRLDTEGARNWKTYFDLPVRDRISIGAIDASMVSFDIFDTLVMRPFLHPSGARAHLAWLVKRNFGIDGFAELRERAENLARERAGKDVNSATIYETLTTMTQGIDFPAQLIHELELETERRLLRPRSAVLDAAHHLRKLGKAVIAISDMYLSRQDLRSVLPDQVGRSLKDIYVSCDTGWRKDTLQTWEQLPALFGMDPKAWLHVGDNEHADIQLPYGLGFIPPVHVLRPHALFDVVPALRPLRLSSAQATHWPNQLLTGLIGNRLTELADRDPGALDDALSLEDPETLGYVVLGPLILDYLAWTNRLAVAEAADKILFLSREGYLLQQAYKTMCDAAGGHTPLGVYLLASRRGVGTPSIREIEHLDLLLDGTFTGTLHALLEARAGRKVADAARSVLGDAAMTRETYLPEMRGTIAETLRPAASAILEIAAEERAAYLRYWSGQVGDSNVLLSDIGYAGTIQSHLSRLVDRGLGGAYFALTDKAGKVAASGGWAKARYCDLRQDPRTGSPVLDHDLLLERFLTSPDGQFSHFEANTNELRPVFAENTRQDFGLVGPLHKGANAFVADACSIIGTDVMTLEFDRQLVQQPLQCFGTGLWRSETWLSRLTAEDHFTGRGQVPLHDRR